MLRRLRWRRGLPISALAVLGCLLSAPLAAAQGPVRIGHLYADVGPFAQFGLDMRDGYLLYWSQFGNTVAGRPIEHVLETQGTRPDDALTKARKLVERDKVHLVGGVVGTPVAYALHGYFQERRQPLIVMTAGADGLTQRQRSPYIFRVSFTNSQASFPLADWAYKQKYRKAVLIGSDFGAGHENLGSFAHVFSELGGQVVQEIYAPFGVPDFAPYLAQIKRDADVAVVAIFGSDAIRFVRQYAEYGLKGRLPIIGKGITTEEILPQQAEPAVGIVNAFHWSAALDTPENRKFLKDFQDKYKRPATPLAEAGYLGAQMIATALRSVKGNVENQEAFLAALRSFEAVAPRGKVKLDPFQSVVHNVYIMRVEKKGDAYQNSVIATYPNVTQFWKWSPDAYLAMPEWASLKGKWAK